MQTLMECCQLSAAQRDAATLLPASTGSGWVVLLSDKGAGRSCPRAPPPAGGDGRAKRACNSGSRAPARLCPTLTTDADAEAKVGRVVRASPGGQEAGFPGKEQRGGEAFGVLVTTSVLS